MPKASDQADDQGSDSGYGSIPEPLTREPSIAQVSDVATTTAPQALSVNSGPADESVPTVPGHAQSAQHTICGLNVWSLNIPRATQVYYSAIHNRLRTGIRNYLIDKKKPTTLLTLALRLLGNTETTAQPYIVVYCHQKSKRRAEKYVRKTYVRELWQSDLSFNLNICVDSCGLERSALELMGDVVGTIESRFGGATIEVLFDETSSLATIGGDVYLNFVDGTSERYGLTAYHVFNHVDGAEFDDGASSSSDSDSSEWSEDGNETDTSVPSVRSFENADSKATGANMATMLWSKMPTASPHYHAESMRPRRVFDDSSRDPESWTGISPAQRVYSRGPRETLSNDNVHEVAASNESVPNRILLGAAVSDTLASDVARNRDWALIEYAQKASNDSVPRRSIEAVAFDPQYGTIEVSVRFHGVAEAGRLCAVPTSTIVPGGTTFVDVYTFTFEQCPVDLDGISGSWVLRETSDTTFVYGQVVAKDRFENLYVVPMVEILPEIQQLYGARMVSLYDLKNTTQQEHGSPATSPMTRASPAAPTENLAQAKLASHDDPESTTWLNIRGSRHEDFAESNLGSQYEETGATQDHGETTEVARPVIKVTPHDHSSLAGRPNEPSIALRTERRLYTSNLGTPVHFKTPENSSVVSDAGQQWGLMMKIDPNTVGAAARRLRRRQAAKESRLSSELIACCQKSNFHDPEQEYFPIGHVKQLISPASVEAEFLRCKEAAQDLEDWGEEEKNGFIIGICEQSYRTFATAVHCGLEKVALLDFMLELQEKYLTDQDLPTVSEDVILDCLGGRDKAKAHNFCIYRWKFLAPTFSPDQYDYNLANDCIFPFHKDATMSRSGGFGTVSRVEIHPDHLDHANLQYIAVKELQISQDKERGATEEAWEDEANALRKINKIKHPHITPCIAAIRRGDRRYFMFPWAEGGNLQEYWMKTAKRSPDTRSVQAMIEQLRGLADALDALHNHKSSDKNNLVGPQSGEPDKDGSIRHGDLKPENILRFMAGSDERARDTEEELGNLKITDMGLAKEHNVATQLRANTSQRYGTIRYEAPEAITETKGRSRLYDVWSLGCITLEFIIWTLHGNTVLEEFYTQVEAGRRQTCQYFELNEDRTGAELHHVVIEWIRRIQLSDPECSQDTAIRELLDIVRNRLLVVNLGIDRLQPVTSTSIADSASPKSRATAAEFRDRLEIILMKGKTIPNYFYTGRSREAVRLPGRTLFLYPNLATVRDSHDTSNERSFVVTATHIRRQESTVSRSRNRGATQSMRMSIARMSSSMLDYTLHGKTNIF